MALQSRHFRGHLAVNLNCSKSFNFMNHPRVKGTDILFRFNTKRWETIYLNVCGARRRETGGHPPELDADDRGVTEDTMSRKDISSGSPSIQRKRKPMRYDRVLLHQILHRPACKYGIITQMYTEPLAAKRQRKRLQQQNEGRGSLTRPKQRYHIQCRQGLCQ